MAGLYSIFKRTPATTTKPGAVLKAAPQIDSVAADVTTLKNDFNALLVKLRAAGHI